MEDAHSLLGWVASTLNLELILFFVAFIAGFFDAIAGGGGLITIPALLLAGLDPMTAIATNKLQGAAGSISATASFARKSMIEWREGRFLVLLGFLGGLMGALSVSYVNKQVLEMCIPLFLVLVAIYFFISPWVGCHTIRRPISVAVFSFSVAPLLGFYDGVFGPGVGSFYMVCFVLLCGLPVIRAVSFTKLANASSNIGALFIFLTKGLIVWPIAISMAIGSILGAQLGAWAVVRLGSRMVRPMIVTVCCALAIKLVLMPSNPLHIFVLTHL